MKILVSSQRIWLIASFVLILTNWTISLPHFTYAGRWRHFLPNEEVNVIVFDSQNRLTWFGTANSGLVKYDGQDYEKFDIQNSAGVLRTNMINALAVDNGFIWIGTNSGMVGYDSILKEWTSFRRGDGLVSDSVSALYIDQRGVLWYGTRGLGLGKFDGKDWYGYNTNGYYLWKSGKWDTLTIYGSGNGPSGDYINTINGDSVGNKYFGVFNKGLCILDCTDKLWTCLSHPTEFPYPINNNVQAIAIDQVNNKWIGTEGGMIKLNVNNQVDTVYNESQGRLLQNNVTAIWIDVFQNKWIGTSLSGVSMLNSTGTRWQSFVADEPDGPASNKIRTITGDTDDNIWFGFQQDLRGASKFNNKWSHLTQEQGLTNNFVIAIARDSKGRLWAGTDAGGIGVFDGSKWGHGPSDNQPFFVTCILSGDCGHVWVGTQHGGLFAMSVNKTAADSLEIKVEDNYRIGNILNFPSNFVFSIAKQEDKILWLGTRRGLCKLSVEKRQCEVFALRSLVGLPDTVRAVVMDKLGNVWAGTVDGLVKYDNQNKKWAIYNNMASKVNALALDTQGTIWVGTDRGIAHFFNSQWETFTTADGLPNNVITTIGSSVREEIWCGTLGGAASFNRNSGTWTASTTDDGLIDNFVTDITFAPQNIVWLSTWGGGLSRFHRTNVSPETQLLNRFDLTLDNNVTFEFTGFDLNTQRNQLRYSYKLDFEQWSKPTFGTFVTRRIEEPGRHKFYVRAIDKDGNVDNSPEELSFTKLKSDKGGGVEIIDSKRMQKYGWLWLYVPPNAIKSETAAINAIPISIYIKDSLFTGIAYELNPDTLEIKERKPITMTFFYGDTVSQEIEDKGLIIHRLENDGEWIAIGGTNDKSNRAVTTTITKLGTFGLFRTTNEYEQERIKAAICKISAQPRIFSPNGRGLFDRITISFDLSKSMQITAKVYNLAGRLVKELCENRSMNPGRNAIEWDGKDYTNSHCSSGLYIITVEGDGELVTKTVMIANK
jgi:ligand-binding sensor domain-containing protein